MIRADVSDLRALSRDLGKLGVRSTDATFDALKESSIDVQTAWRRNAKATSGAHARRYPETITAVSRIGLNIEFEISPDSRINPQANLGTILEFGGPHSPAHLDGQRAMDEVEPRMMKRIDEALGKSLKDL